MTFSVESMAVCGLIFVFAAFIHGSIGFGFPMVATPLLSLFMDVQTAVGLTILPTLMLNVVSISAEGQLLAALKRYLPLAILAMIGSSIGTQILLLFDSTLFKIVLASTILFYLAGNVVDFHIPWIKRHPKKSLYLFGLLGGMMGGLTNVMAPLLVIYTLEAGYGKRETVQALNLCFLLGKCIQLVLFLVNGKYALTTFEFSAAGTLLACLALLLGVRVKQKVPLVLYQRLLKMLLLVLAGMLFVQGM